VREPRLGYEANMNDRVQDRALDDMFKPAVRLGEVSGTDGMQQKDTTSKEAATSSASQSATSPESTKLGTGKLRRFDQMRRSAEKYVGENAWLASESSIKQELGIPSIDITQRLASALAARKAAMNARAARRSLIKQETRADERLRCDMSMKSAAMHAEKSKPQSKDSPVNLPSDVTQYATAGSDDQGSGSGASIMRLAWRRATRVLVHGGSLAILAWPVGHWLFSGWGPHPCALGRGPHPCTCTSCASNAN